MNTQEFFGGLPKTIPREFVYIEDYNPKALNNAIYAGNIDLVKFLLETPVISNYDFLSPRETSDAISVAQSLGFSFIESILKEFQSSSGGFASVQTRNAITRELKDLSKKNPSTWRSGVKNIEGFNKQRNRILDVFYGTIQIGNLDLLKFLFDNKDISYFSNLSPLDFEYGITVAEEDGWEQIANYLTTKLASKRNPKTEIPEFPGIQPPSAEYPSISTSIRPSPIVKEPIAYPSIPAVSGGSLKDLVED